MSSKLELETEEQRLKTVTAKYNVLVNGITFLMMDKEGGLESDILRQRLFKEVRKLIAGEVKEDTNAVHQVGA